MRFPAISRYLLLPTLSLVLLCSCDDAGEESDFPRLTGDYFGQTPPGPEPELFAPGLISTGLIDRDMAMTPDGDEMYFTIATPGYAFSAIVETRRVDGVWTQPEVASFCRNPDWSALEPHISPNGNRFFFVSNRPNGPDAEIGNSDIWVMDRTDNRWGEPYNLGGPINTDNEEFYPSVTNDGTMYFTRAGSGSPVNNIYRSRLIDGVYQEPELLPAEVNSGPTQFNAFVAPDESFIIVPVAGRQDGLGGVDQYISFRDDQDRWTGPFNLGEGVNSPAMREWSSYLTPDGKYLFFMSDRRPDQDGSAPINYGEMLASIHSPQNGNPDIYWMDAAFILDLRTQSRTDVPEQEGRHE